MQDKQQSRRNFLRLIAVISALVLGAGGMMAWWAKHSPITAQNVEETDMLNNESPVMEFYTFEIKEGVKEEEFYAKHDRFVEEFLRQQKGFSSSQLWKTGEGRFAIVNTWRNMASAEQTMKNFDSSEIGSEWYALVNTETEELHHYAIERRYF